MYLSKCQMVVKQKTMVQIKFSENSKLFPFKTIFFDNAWKCQGVLDPGSKNLLRTQNFWRQKMTLVINCSYNLLRCNTSQPLGESRHHCLTLLLPLEVKPLIQAPCIQHLPVKYNMTEESSFIFVYDSGQAESYIFAHIFYLLLSTT